MLVVWKKITSTRVVKMTNFFEMLIFLQAFEYFKIANKILITI